MLHIPSCLMSCSCNRDGLRWVLTEIVRLEDLKLVDETLWKTTEALGVTPSCPFNRTRNSTDGVLSIWTKKFPLPCGSTTPLISSDPDNSTRATSVTVAESLPVKDTNKLTLTPSKKKKVRHAGLVDVMLRFIKFTSWKFPLPVLGRVSRASNPLNGPCEASTKSNRKSTALWPANYKNVKKAKVCLIQLSLC